MLSYVQAVITSGSVSSVIDSVCPSMTSDMNHDEQQQSCDFS